METWRSGIECPANILLDEELDILKCDAGSFRGAIGKVGDDGLRGGRIEAGIEPARTSQGERCAMSKTHPELPSACAVRRVATTAY